MKQMTPPHDYPELFFRFSTLNSDAILALTQADFRPNSANFLCLTQNFGNFQQILMAVDYVRQERNTYISRLLALAYTVLTMPTNPFHIYLCKYVGFSLNLAEFLSNSANIFV